jgi:hypothetical protein
MRTEPTIKRQEERKIKWLKERKCSEKGCYNRRADGYVLCLGHLYGFPHRMTDDEIEALKEAGL